jgi:2-polyprenyl-3-methyl-5-hydroxy-6-metoxy-1,4-benzoquinol methylase
VDRQFPNWHEFYRQLPVAQMPWYYPELDPDLERALTKHQLTQGSALDLGTGPGTQAFMLARRGFRVTATDISADAITLARTEAAQRGLAIHFEVDDVLASRLNSEFDIVFDRGCFHVLSPNDRPRYVETIAKLVKPQGFFFLKCLSEMQPGDVGPYRSSPEEIEATFQGRFKLLWLERTIYQGTLIEPPHALFCSFQRQ